MMVITRRGHLNVWQAIIIFILGIIVGYLVNDLMVRPDDDSDPSLVMCPLTVPSHIESTQCQAWCNDV